MTYRHRQAPRRFFEGAPDIVKAQVLDFIKIEPAAPLDFDIIFRPDPGPDQIVGLDFDIYGASGCHFFLTPWEARAYRGRNRRKRAAWLDLPEPTRRAIVAYLEN